MNSRRLWTLFVLGVALALGVSAIQSKGQAKTRQMDERFSRPVGFLLDKIEQEYCGEEVSYDKLAEGAIQGILSKLDEHSVYLPPEQYQLLEADTKGEFGGLGIQIRYDVTRGVVVVDQVIPGTPAFSAGVLADDLIVEVIEDPDDKPIMTSDFDNVFDAVKILRGKPGDEVTIVVLRGKERAREDITIKRGIIHVRGVRAVQMVDPKRGIGYVYVAYFNEQTVHDLQKAIGELRDNGAKGLIIDLRFNPGGLLESAVRFSNLFLDGKLIVRTKGESGPTRVYRANPGEAYPGMPVVILVNRGSASASEIVAAALSDNGRATIVGGRTHGKASVQKIFPLPGRGAAVERDAIKLTVAHYYTPSDQPIAKKGVTPDVNIPLDEDQLPKLAKLLAEKIAYSPPNEKDKQPPTTEEKGSEQPQAEEEKPFEDVQLQRAIDVMIELLDAQHQPKESPETAPALQGALQ